MPCRLGEGTGPKGPANGEAPQRLKHEAPSYLPRVLKGEVAQVHRDPERAPDQNGATGYRSDRDSSDEAAARGHLLPTSLQHDDIAVHVREPHRSDVDTGVSPKGVLPRFGQSQTVLERSRLGGRRKCSFARRSGGRGRRRLG